ncbi:fimbrial protein [Burkholderia contaminans]|nr:fimbrial protein [Burkholderia contaminans]
MYRWIFFVLVALFSREGFALACLNNATPVYDWGVINTWRGEGSMGSGISTTIAVPGTAPKNTVLWRSPEVSLKITCWPDQAGPKQNVYIYLSPDDPGYTKLGPDLELGVTVNGVDYYCNNGMEVFGGRCRKKLDWNIEYCSRDGGCGELYYQAEIKISFLVIKRSASGPGKEGALSGVSGLYGAFQLDGVNGMNSHPLKNFRMNVTGLNKLRYIACDSKLSISPNLINFGSVGMYSAAVGRTIKEVPFVITASKSCNSVYGLNAMMNPVNSTTPDGYMIVPTDNKSVAISILKGGSREVVPLNREFVLVEPSGDMVSVKKFSAMLKWNTSKPVLGNFNAGATFDVFYK